MTLELTADEAALVTRAEAFSREVVAPNAAAWERERRLPREAIAASVAVGLTGIEVPKEHGGQGARFRAKLKIAEVMARDCMAFVFSVINTQNVAARLVRDATPAAIARFVPDIVAGRIMGASALTEPSAGSDFGAIKTRAEKVDGGWVLTGAKGWIANAAEADVFWTYAQTDPEKGWRGIGSFIVDGRRDGFTREAPYQLMGGHAIGTGGFRMDRYFCPDDEMLGEPGEAFKTALTGINGARAYVAAMCCGMVEASLAHAVAYGRERTTFGKRLIDHQGLAWGLADVATDLEAARLLTYRAAELVDTDGDAILAAAHAKKFATEMAVGRIAECIQAMGANGLREDYPLGRHLACAKIGCYTDGSIEIMNDRIARDLDKVYGRLPVAPCVSTRAMAS